MTDEDKRTNARTGEVVPAPRLEFANGRLIPAPGLQLADCPTNLPLDSPRGKALALAALGEGDVSVAALDGKPFPTSYYLVTPGESVDPETGELKQYPRLVLIGQDGRTLVTTSIVVPRLLQAVLSLYGPGPWAPPLPLIVTERRSRRTGRTYHDLRMQTDAE